MAINAYLNFNGNCREAVEYYAKVFDTEIQQITSFGEMPPDPNFTVPDEVKNFIMHARLNLEGSTVMFSDTFPGMPFIEGNNISLAIASQDLDRIHLLYNRLKEGGTVNMELQETFWSKSYGSLKDKFGIEWQVSHDSGEM